MPRKPRTPEEARINPHRTAAQILARNDKGEKQCNRCWEWLSTSHFREMRSRKSIDGLNPMCKLCDRYRSHKLTKKDVLQLLADQGSSCAVCGSVFYSPEDFHIDHDHACCPYVGSGASCGKCVRGLLCRYCNYRVMCVLDNAEIVERGLFYAAEYQNAVAT